MRPLLRAVALGLGLGALLLVVGLGALLVVVPKVTGATPLTVLTSSMAPTLPPGTLVVVQPTAPGAIRVGEVATYQIASGRPEVVTHRVVAITTTSTGERLFTFRGDANATADEKLVSAVQVRGVVWYSVPGVGWVNDAVNGPGRAWIVPLVAVALFAYAAVAIGRGLVAGSRGRRSSGRRSSGHRSHGRRRRGPVHLYE